MGTGAAAPFASAAAVEVVSDGTVESVVDGAGAGAGTAGARTGGSGALGPTAGAGGGELAS